eukprot:6759479-Alexandrium_andersonii.AAC.1
MSSGSSAAHRHLARRPGTWTGAPSSGARLGGWPHTGPGGGASTYGMRRRALPPLWGRGRFQRTSSGRLP